MVLLECRFPKGFESSEFKSHLHEMPTNLPLTPTPNIQQRREASRHISTRCRRGRASWQRRHGRSCGARTPRPVTSSPRHSRMHLLQDSGIAAPQPAYISSPTPSTWHRTKPPELLCLQKKKTNSSPLHPSSRSLASVLIRSRSSPASFLYFFIYRPAGTRKQKVQPDLDGTIIN